MVIFNSFLFILFKSLVLCCVLFSIKSHGHTINAFNKILLGHFQSQSLRCSDLKESVRISCCEVSQNPLKEKMSPQQDHGSYRAYLTWWLIVHLSPCSLQANLPAPIALPCHIISVSVAKDLWITNSSRHSSATEMRLQSWHHHSRVRLLPEAQTCERGCFCGFAASLSMLLYTRDAMIKNATSITSPNRANNWSHPHHKLNYGGVAWVGVYCLAVMLHNWEVHAELFLLWVQATNDIIEASYWSSLESSAAQSVHANCKTVGISS